MCQKVHEGPVLVLYIDIDDADITALPMPANAPVAGTSASAQGSSSSSSGNPAESGIVDTPNQQQPATATQPVEDGRNELLDRIEELETSMDRQIRAMEQRHAREKERLNSQIVARNNEIIIAYARANTLQSTIDDLQYDVDSYERRSEGHRNHIRSLQRKLADSEARADEATNDLAEADAEIDDLVEKVKELSADVERLEAKADGQRRHINSLQSKLQTSENDLYAANDEIDRLTALSDAHRSHITSLQRAVEDKKSIIYELEGELSGETEYGDYDDSYDYGYY
ncbi:hypothetical protein H4R20_003307 [Coemansia guatemalensis]|uniref:Uncharacterized protein n=1 Tax=Coemansia guatemalensis TaxID=2761395 RepID=A0A9W8HVI2_9FUNG|nr:hypothetical protein H4R20_003307 [Coemansia guatemalensis]